VDYLETERRYGSGAYGFRGITLVKGEGARVWDEAGNSYIDCVAGQGAVIIGHAHPAIAEAISGQSRRLVSCPGIFANDRRAQLLERLITHCNRNNGADFAHAFLTNSGAESVEGALKFARYVSGRSGIIGVRRGFHGRTFGALSLTWRKKYRKPFQPLLNDVHHVSMNNIAAAEESITKDVAAVVIEPVQGEGGIIPAAEEYLQALRNICDDRGVVLIFDEIQTGFGRTGDWFAFHRYGVQPDILTLAKGIAGGFPMGAVVFRESLGQLAPGSHGSTFGGNPLACAASLASMQVLEDQQLPGRARRLGRTSLDYLQQELANVDCVREVRGLGLMIGIDLRVRVTPVLKRLMDRGILGLPSGSTVLRLLPPLNIPQDDWKIVLNETVEILKAMPVRSRREAQHAG